MAPPGWNRELPNLWRMASQDYLSSEWGPFQDLRKDICAVMTYDHFRAAEDATKIPSRENYYFNWEGASGAVSYWSPPPIGISMKGFRPW